MKKLSKKEEKKLELSNFEQYQEYYWKTRQLYEQSFIHKMSLQTRKRLYPLLYRILKLRNKLLGNKLSMINNTFEHTDRPKIYAITHLGKLDIEMISEALKEHYYVLSGDFENLHGTMDGLFLEVNGIIYVNENDKEDRKKVRETMISTLKSGGNIMYFPEGTWNLTPNLPVLQLFPGIIDIARESNAIIVPIAIEQYDKQFIGNVGHNFDVETYYKEGLSREQIKDLLRDTLATLKWEIYETVPMLDRTKSRDQYFDEMITSRMSEWPGFTYEEVISKEYKDKNVTTPDEAFEHLKHLQPKKENAFLLRRK